MGSKRELNGYIKYLKYVTDDEECGLINNGFILMRRKDLKIYKILKRDAAIRSLVFGKTVLFFIHGREEAAERALISNSKVISKRQLNTIKQIFIQNKKIL